MSAKANTKGKPDVETALEIAHHELSLQALRGVIEAFVLQEGTDYGERDFSLEDKVAQVERQLDRGEAKLVYDGRTASVNIIVRG